MPLTPLLADVGELFGVIAALVGLVIWIIQKISEANKAAHPKPRPVPPAAQEAGQGGARAAAEGQQADPLRAQVEEFMRRANQGNLQPANQGGAQARRIQTARDIELLVDDEAIRRERPSVSPQRQSVAPPLRSAQPGKSGRSSHPRKRKSLAERAEERAAARSESIARQVSQLGHRIIKEDAQFDVQVKSKFDHSLGSLASGDMAPVELVPIEKQTPAGQIAAMLSNPEGIRQAIVLNEVLQRPIDRW